MNSKYNNVTINIELNKFDMLLNSLKEYFLENNNKNNINEIFDDFEIEILDINSKIVNGFASSISLDNCQKDLNKVINLKIKNGLFTDASGYCHKIKIDKTAHIRML